MGSGCSSRSCRFQATWKMLLDKPCAIAMAPRHKICGEPDKMRSVSAVRTRGPGALGARGGGAGTPSAACALASSAARATAHAGAARAMYACSARHAPPAMKTDAISTCSCESHAAALAAAAAAGASPAVGA